MQINVDFKKYSSNLLRRLEEQLKNSKYEWEKDLLKEEIEKHKNNYSDYLK